MELKRYLVLVWRWLWLVLLGAILFGGVAYVLNIRTTPVYRATARLLIDEAPNSSSGNEYSQILVEQRLAQTYVTIMNTRPVREEIVQKLNLPFSADALAGKITISAPQDSQIIIVTVEDTDPQRAADIANTLGDVFIAQNQARESLRYAEPIATWDARLKELGDQIEGVNTRINTLGTPTEPEKIAELSRLETQLKELQIQYTEAFNNHNELQVSKAKESSNIVPVEPAQAAKGAIRPNTIANTLMAAVVGAVVGLGVIALIEYLDDTIKTPDQVLEDTGLSTLGAIAYIKGATYPERLVAHLLPRNPVTEAFRMLRTNLYFASIDSGLHSLVITSASPGEGKSTTAANLAVVLAQQSGNRVLLVDADLRRPSQHKLFSVSNNQGLTTAILDSVSSVQDHIQETEVPGLRIMTSGPIPPNPAELLNSQRMLHVMADLQKEADVIIYDMPPVLTVADASILATHVNGCFLVAAAGETRREAFIQAAERLNKASINVYGAVMNRSQPDRQGYYYHYYDYFYYSSYDYGHRRQAKRPLWQRPFAWLSSSNKR